VGGQQWLWCMYWPSRRLSREAPKTKSLAPDRQAWFRAGLARLPTAIWQWAGVLAMLYLGLIACVVPALWTTYPFWSISLFLCPQDYRRQGVMSQLSLQPETAKRARHRRSKLILSTRAHRKHIEHFNRYGAGFHAAGFKEVLAAHRLVRSCATTLKQSRA